MRFKNPAEAINFLVNHERARIDRKTGTLTIEKPSLRCLGAFQYLKKQHALGLHVHDGKLTVFSPSRFLNMTEVAAPVAVAVVSE